MAKLIWYFPETKKDDELYRLLVRFPKVGRRSATEASKIYSKASAIHAAHHAHNIKDPRADSRIEMERGDRGVDAFVKLVDPDDAALQIEHEIKVLRKAAGLV